MIERFRANSCLLHVERIFCGRHPATVWLCLLLLVSATPAVAQEFYLLQGSGVSIRFEPSLQPAARQAAQVYPRIRDELQRTFGWEMSFRPTVYLIGSRRRFHHLADNPSIVAYARPGDNVVVIDCSRLHIRPHRLESVLKHEMIHLLLHRHIRNDLLPRWLDEGVAQWLSGGLAELLTTPHPSILEEALLSGDFIPLGELQAVFPRQRMALMLAYEESRSFVNHIAAEYGDRAVFDLLNRLKNGDRFQTAFAAALQVDFRVEEQRWIEQLRSRSTWFTYLAVHLYEYLFVFAALLTVIGFVRFVVRKRAYRDDEEQ